MLAATPIAYRNLFRPGSEASSRRPEVAPRNSRTRGTGPYAFPAMLTLRHSASQAIMWSG
ncbi:hypothetical protein [Fodinicola feengrottensis]|uniref:hypothetical protein n=1 Tax=Fodinicola feengrottensis TaxID=435914 RepID=UPI002441D41F|nr:hypothetical protein [Fodinicola feengrottensis]